MGPDRKGVFYSNGEEHGKPVSEMPPEPQPRDLSVQEQLQVVYGCARLGVESLLLAEGVLAELRATRGAKQKKKKFQ